MNSAVCNYKISIFFFAILKIFRLWKFELKKSKNQSR